VSSFSFHRSDFGVIRPSQTSKSFNKLLAPFCGTTSGALDDPNRDGVCNLLAFVFGGATMNSAVSVLPTLTQSGGNWIFEYDRSDVSLLGTTQVVEYGSEFGTWTPISIPATSSGSVTITPGSPSDHVRVVVPASGARMFMRLKVAK